MAHLWYQEHILASGDEDHTAFVAHEVEGTEEGGLVVWPVMGFRGSRACLRGHEGWWKTARERQR